MNPMSEIGLIVARELRKNLRSAKGIVLLILSLLGGTVVALLIVAVYQHELGEIASKLSASPDQLREAQRAGQEKLFTEAFNDATTGRYLSTAPIPLVAMLVLSVWLAPLLIALAGFDAISGEVQYRAVRFWTVRTRRSSYFIGKFLGTWCAVSVITFFMNAFMWGVTIARGSFGAGETLSWGLRFWLISVPISAAWCGIATLVGSLFRTPILGLLTTFVAFFVVWFFGWAIARKFDVDWLGRLYPNNYDTWLMSAHPERVLAAIGICLLFAAVPLAAGTLLFRQRDV